jgi:hypothetical protein
LCFSCADREAEVEVEVVQGLDCRETVEVDGSLCCRGIYRVSGLGMGAGVIYATLGGTHHTQDDIAIAGAPPNMQIIAPCDPAECTEANAYCAIQKDGPVYLRLGKAGEPASPAKQAIRSASCATSSAVATCTSCPTASSCQRRCSLPPGLRQRDNRSRCILPYAKAARC